MASARRQHLLPRPPAVHGVFFQEWARPQLVDIVAPPSPAGRCYPPECDWMRLLLLLLLLGALASASTTQLRHGSTPPPPRTQCSPAVVKLPDAERRAVHRNRFDSQRRRRETAHRTPRNTRQKSRRFVDERRKPITRARAIISPDLEAPDHPSSRRTWAVLFGIRSNLANDVVMTEL